VIARAHAKARKTNPHLKALNALDYLSAVDDFSRMGALRLAQRAGIDAADSKVVLVGDTPVVIIRRFDRTAEHGRIHYLSAASMLQTNGHEERSYTEIADIIRAKCANPTADAQQLWRRLVFNLLITNVDDHLQNLAE
jgi:serine/threonine-protein kinase HipA